MATQTTGGGSTTSLTNTPQATDNCYSGYEDYVFTFDVMADDLGGAAKILWSIDDTTMKDDSGTGTYDLLTADNTPTSVPEYSDLGARIWIQDGQVKYDTNALDWLADGQIAYDRFTYAIRLGNGTLSWATVYVTLVGREDLPAIVSGAEGTASVQEDVSVFADGKLHDSGNFGFTDVDLTDSHTVSVTPGASGYLGTLNAIVSDDSTSDGSGQINWRFGVDNSAVQYLGEGEVICQTYTVTVDDGHGGTASQTIEVKIYGTNDAPVLTVDTSGGVTEDIGVVGGNVSDTGVLSFTDADVNDAHNVTFVYNGDAAWSDGTLSAGQIAALAAGFSVDSDSWDYSVANALLNFLGAGETITLSFDVTVTDDSGAANDSDTETVTITIHGTNDAPEVESAVSDQHVNEDTAWNFTVPAGTFSDPDANDNLVYSATLANGDPLPAWLTFNPLTQEFSGTPPANFNGTIGLKVTASDSSLSTSDTFNLVIDPVNDAPVASGSATLGAIAEDTASPVGATVLSLFGGNFSDAADQVSGGSSANTFNGIAISSYTADAAKGVWQYSTDGGTSWTPISGTSSTTALTLDGDDLLRFVPAANYNGAATSLSANLIESGLAITSGATIDLTGATGGTTHISSGTVALNENITAVNDAPVNTMPASYSTNEDTAKQLTGLSVADVDAGSGTVKVTLSVDGGTLAATSGSGVTVSGSGTGSIDLTGTLADINAYLGAASAPVFTPAANANGDVTLTMTTTDNGFIGSGGAQSDTDSIAIHVAAVNDAAVITGDDARSITEDAVPNTVSGNLDSTDVDGVNDSWNAQTIASVNSYGSLTINADGTWTYTLDNTNATVNALNTGSPALTDTFTVHTADGTAHDIVITINGHTDATAVTPPPTFNGTDPNDFDTLVGTGAANNSATINGDNTLNDNITGGGADQNIDGKGGNDTIYGAGGNDSLTGNNGDDTLYGQAGVDTISGNNGNDAIYGGSGDDIINGGNDVDTIYGGSGGDTINGMGGNDFIIGGFGADTLTGGGDNDTFVYLDVRDTNDTITDFNAGDHIDFSAIDSNPGLAGDQAFTFGGTTATAHGVWYSTAGGNTTVYVDTDGDTSTAELVITLTGVTSISNTDFLLGP